MFALFQPKTPDQALHKLLNKITAMPQQKKFNFIHDNYPIIIAAMDKAEAVIHFSDNPTREAKRAEGYLKWRAAFYDVLKDQETKTDTTESNYFLGETKAGAKAAFFHLFAIDPKWALYSLYISKKYNAEILEKMKGLLTHPDPKLYFKALETILKMSVLQDPDFRIELGGHTIEAVAKILSTNDSLDFLNDNSNDLIEYMPDESTRRALVNKHLDIVVASFSAVAITAHSDHLQKINQLCNAFPEGEVPAALQKVKTHMLAEQVKKCFHLAADPRSDLNSMIADLSVEEDSLERAGFYHTNRPHSSDLRIVQLNNPTMPFEVDDVDHGEDSKHLWLLVEDEMVLASSFTAAGLRGYLEVQRSIPAEKAPTIAELNEFGSLTPNNS